MYAGLKASNATLSTAFNVSEPWGQLVGRGNRCTRSFAVSRAQSLVDGIKQGISDSRFQPRIEVTDLLKAPATSINFWMVCIRSAQSDETKRITYAAFFKDKYVQSRYSVYYDGCGGQ
jgi:hypothetical protein